MQYEEFVDLFLEEFQQALNAQAVALDRLKVTKNNSVVKDGVAVRYPDSTVLPTVYLDDLYEMHKDGCPVNRLVDTVLDRLEKGKNEFSEMPKLTSEAAREKMFCVIINTAENAEMLKNVPNERLEDLSVVARFRVGEDSSFLVTNDICRTLQMTSEEVMEAAHANTERQEYTCQSMEEVMRDMMLQDGMSEEYVDDLIQMQGEQSPMWVLTNTSKVDGAVAITSSDVLQTAHAKLGEDFYVLPSSRHEVILVPESKVSDVEDLKAMVREVNATEVRKIDKLSDSVYHYNGKRLSIADAPTEKLGEAVTEGMSKGHSRSH